MTDDAEPTECPDCGAKDFGARQGINHAAGCMVAICVGCRDPEEWLTYANPAYDLCKEHTDEYFRSRGEVALREVIPPMFHSAHPRDLPDALSGWKATPGSGLYLYGPVGSGKSHAAAALIKRGYVQQAKDDFSRTPTVAWMNVPTAIIASLTAFSRRSDVGAIWDGAQRASLTVLDDIGVEQPKDWVRMRMYGLIEHRLQWSLPTIVTSNLDLEQLAERLESPQIASRLSQMTAQVSFEGRKDRRPDLSPSLGKGEK